jgi:hypothetical protein
VPRSCIAGSYGSSILSFLRNLHTAFHNGCTNLHSQKHCIRVPVSLHPHQHLLMFLPLSMDILPGVQWNLSVVLICIYFIAGEVEHLLMYLLVICNSPFENSLLNSCAHFFSVMLTLWELSFF